MASTDNLFAMISFFVAGLVILIMALLWQGFAGVDELWSQPDQGAKIKADVQSFVDNWDFIMVCIYFSIHLAILGLAFFLPSHPVIYVPAIGFTILLVIIAAPLSNSFADILVNSSFSAVSGDFPMMGYIFSMLPVFELIWAILTMVFLFGFAKPEGLF